MSSPDRALFLKRLTAGDTFIPIAHRWPADLETPLTTWLKVRREGSCGVLLESVEGGETLGRWSTVAVDPLWIAEARGDGLEQRWRDGRRRRLTGNPFDLLRELLGAYRTGPQPDLPALGQLFGFWGYELIRWIEPTVPVHDRPGSAPPDGCWMLADSLLIFDQVKRQITAVAYADVSDGQDPDRAYSGALERIATLERAMQAPLPPVRPLAWSQTPQRQPAISVNRSREDFEAAVQQARAHIAAGDVFQLVLSQKLSASVSHEPLDLYRSLRMVNPSPYMAFFDFGSWCLIGSSPEVMVKAAPGPAGVKASLRPIAGTRPRGASPEEDERLEEDLLADPKERAEHVMLVDLGRNDLGRVCRPGSVRVQDLMVIERYSHVMHIVSEVEGWLADGLDIWDLLMASFPAGTVSGAPKIRAMQLIHALEPEARGPYSGVYGSVDLAGAINTAITIRTMVVQRDAPGTWRVQVQAGAGLVADSRPDAEYEETLNKARALLTSLACLASPAGGERAGTPETTPTP
ncbi:anthranilate synthase component I family protein [Synechococcus sp. RSCCF101]|uniref:anthranilate synthase component I family protein n=1 Tax=Synechococcus sp. RSCCF101 TaxID=2511069 RepID=UPI001244E141|nr:anthranilate synthase component I family protein [Synechococcus sp. RSCCF101]QEY32152.1 anthranilate synthase component I family protein [Synechococcus sp. RSCCF101]